MRLLVLDLPNATVVVITIGTYCGICRTVNGAAGVVVNDRLVAEIDKVDRSIWAGHHFDGAKPEIVAADELSFFATSFFRCSVRDPVFGDIEVTNDV